MLMKVYDLLRSLGWYIVSFIYNLIDSLITIIKKLNVFDIIEALSNNKTFKSFYTSIMVIAVSLFALFIIWKFINKFLDPDDESSVKSIFVEIAKCGALIMLTTFLFIQVSNFSISLSGFMGNIFEDSTNVSMSNSMLSLFITYRDDYKNSEEFDEPKSIEELVESGSFDKDELYIDKYVTESRIILSDYKDYKYDVNWIMAILCGGFFLYSLCFAGIMLGRRQIEFLFLFVISPIVFATSIGNKQRRGAVIEQLVSLVLQSSVVMLIVSLTIMVMKEVNATTFFTNGTMNMVIKALLYLGCATFVMTGSQVINRFIGNNVSASSGREQLMSLMGYGKMAGVAGTVGAGATIGGGLLATGAGMKMAKDNLPNALTNAGIAIGNLGGKSSSKGMAKVQKVANSLGTRMVMKGQGIKAKQNASQRLSAGEALMNAGATSINSTLKKVMPRSSYNIPYYRRKRTIETNDSI